MTYLTKLKLSPITNLSDARFAAAAGIDYMGFCFDPSSVDFLLPIKAKEIIEWTSGSYAIGEFGEQSVEEITALSDLLNMDVVAINNSLLPDELPQIGKPIIKIIEIENRDLAYLKIELQAYTDVVAGFQLNGSFNTTITENALQEICKEYKVFLNLILAPEVLQATLQEIQPYAFILQAGSEEKTGMKEYDDLNEMLELLKA
jgi:phosphoribosylanthranilate isomerase